MNNEQWDIIRWRLSIYKRKIFVVLLGVFIGLVAFEIKRGAPVLKGVGQLRYKVIPEKSGLIRQYYKSGELLSEGQYAKGKLNGFYREYYRSGQLKVESNFVQGKLEGVSKAYDESGRLIVKEIYRTNEIIHRAVY